MATGIETDSHRLLKRLAIDWARERGFTGIACEVRLPRSAFRADVAGYKAGKRGVLGTTAVFECKQARADFLRDSYRQDATRTRLLALDQRRQKLEELLKMHLPSLRRGETLFAELDAIRLDGYEHKTYRRVLREMETMQRRLAGKTKFDRLARYRCANLNYLVVEPGIVQPEETPVGWGLLVRQSSSGGPRSVVAEPDQRTRQSASLQAISQEDVLVLEREPIWQEADWLALLENIAATASRRIVHEI